MRSRAVRRPFLCCASLARGPPPSSSLASSFLISVRKFTMRRVLFAKSLDSRLTRVASTALGKCQTSNFSGAPSEAGRNKLQRAVARHRGNVTVYLFCAPFAEPGANQCPGPGSTWSPQENDIPREINLLGVRACVRADKLHDLLSRSPREENPRNTR